MTVHPHKSITSLSSVVSKISIEKNEQIHLKTTVVGAILSQQLQTTKLAIENRLSHIFETEKLHINIFSRIVTNNDSVSFQKFAELD